MTHEENRDDGATPLPNDARTRAKVALITAAAGILTLGFASPVAIILSLMAMRRGATRMAGLALALGLVGLGLGIYLFGLSAKNKQTVDVFVDLELRLKDYHDDHDRYPNGTEFEALFGPREDGWGHVIRYRQDDESYVLQAAGPDGEFGTDDDSFGGPDPK